MAESLTYLTDGYGVIVLVLVFNRRAWILAVAALVGGLWYEVIASRRPTWDRSRFFTWLGGPGGIPMQVVVHLVNRPRPTVGQILA